ncbi:MAG: hypothetical protein KDK66_00170 [Deltaproteobacteria bacterium]|nr:hypothetical protein [Deltaproteobacteria bacterium]
MAPPNEIKPKLGNFGLCLPSSEPTEEGDFKSLEVSPPAWQPYLPDGLSQEDLYLPQEQACVWPEAPALAWKGLGNFGESPLSFSPNVWTSVSLEALSSGEDEEASASMAAQSAGFLPSFLVPLGYALYRFYRHKEAGDYRLEIYSPNQERLYVVHFKGSTKGLEAVGVRELDSNREDTRTTLYAKGLATKKVRIWSEDGSVYFSFQLAMGGQGYVLLNSEGGAMSVNPRHRPATSVVSVDSSPRWQSDHYQHEYELLLNNGEILSILYTTQDQGAWEILEVEVGHYDLQGQWLARPQEEVAWLDQEGALWVWTPDYGISANKERHSRAEAGASPLFLGRQSYFYDFYFANEAPFIFSRHAFMELWDPHLLSLDSSHLYALDSEGWRSYRSSQEHVEIDMDSEGHLGGIRLSANPVIYELVEQESGLLVVFGGEYQGVLWELRAGEQGLEIIEYNDPSLRRWLQLENSRLGFEDSNLEVALRASFSDPAKMEAIGPALARQVRDQHLQPFLRLINPFQEVDPGFLHEVLYGVSLPDLSTTSLIHSGNQSLKAPLAANLQSLISLPLGGNALAGIALNALVEGYIEPQELRGLLADWPSRPELHHLLDLGFALEQHLAQEATASQERPLFIFDWTHQLRSELNSLTARLALALDTSYGPPNVQALYDQLGVTNNNLTAQDLALRLMVAERLYRLSEEENLRPWAQDALDALIATEDLVEDDWKELLRLLPDPHLPGLTERSAPDRFYGFFGYLDFLPAKSLWPSLEGFLTARQFNVEERGYSRQALEQARPWSQQGEVWRAGNFSLSIVNAQGLPALTWTRESGEVVQLPLERIRRGSLNVMYLSSTHERVGRILLVQWGSLVFALNSPSQLQDLAQLHQAGSMVEAYPLLPERLSTIERRQAIRLRLEALRPMGLLPNEENALENLGTFFFEEESRLRLYGLLLDIAGMRNEDAYETQAAVAARSLIQSIAVGEIRDPRHLEVLLEEDWTQIPRETLGDQLDTEIHHRLTQALYNGMVQAPVDDGEFLAVLEELAEASHAPSSEYLENTLEREDRVRFYRSEAWPTWRRDLESIEQSRARSNLSRSDFDRELRALVRDQLHPEGPRRRSEEELDLNFAQALEARVIQEERRLVEERRRLQAEARAKREEARKERKAQLERLEGKKK